MHLSTPDDSCRPEPVSGHTGSLDGAGSGGWGSFLARAFLWAAIGWLVTHALNRGCSSPPTAMPTRPVDSELRSP